MNIYIILAWYETATRKSNTRLGNQRLNSQHINQNWLNREVTSIGIPVLMEGNL